MTLFLLRNHDNDDPWMNLALEEYALRRLDTTCGYLLFYINRPSVIIGRNQNPLREVDTAYLDREGIPVVRRISGGGAVYHDHGNLNYSFITPFDPGHLNNYAPFTAPVIAVLQGMGVPAEASARNDILAAGKKISGTAQFASGKRILTHGTLLFNARLDALARALEGPSGRVISRAVASVVSPVANIREFLPAGVSMGAFRRQIQAGIAAAWGGAEEVRLGERDWDGVIALAREKYRSWQWTHGRSPRFEIQRSTTCAGGAIEVSVVVERGRIAGIAIRGPFPDPDVVRALEARLTGCRYRGEDIQRQLWEAGIEKTPVGIPLSRLMGSLAPE